MKRKYAEPAPRVLSGTHVIVAILVVIAIAVSFFRIGDESMWADEQNSLRIAKMSFAKILKGPDQTHPPGYHLMLRIWISLFGSSDIAARSLSALFAILCIPAMFILGKDLFDSRTGIIAAAITTVSVFMVTYAQEARPYAIITFVTIVSSWLLWRALDGQRRHELAYVASALVGLYLHYFFVFVVMVHVLVAGFHALRHDRSRLKTYAMIFLPVTIIFGAWAVTHFIPSLLREGVRLTAWIDRPGIAAVSELVRRFVGLPYVPTIVGISIISCILALAYLPVLFELAIRRRAPSRGEMFVLTSFVLPLLLVFLISQFHPVWVTRYLIITYPFFALICARSFSRLRFMPLIGLALLVLLAVNVYSLNLLYTQIDKEDWRAANVYVENNYREGDIIIRYSLPPFLLEHYRRPGTRLEQVGFGPLENETPTWWESFVLGRAVEGRYRVFIIYGGDYPTPALDAPLKKIDNSFVRTASNTWKNIRIDLYERPLKLNNQTIKFKNVFALPVDNFTCSGVSAFNGTLPLFSKYDVATYSVNLESGNYLMLLEARGTDPPPVGFAVDINGQPSYFTMNAPLGSYRTLSMPVTIDFGRMDMRIEFTNETYIAQGGIVQADNALFIRNIRLVRLQ